MPTILFSALGQFGYSAGGIIDRFRLVIPLQTYNLAILIDLEIDLGTFFKIFHLLLLWILGQWQD
jgi:hypothetical protein